MTAGGGGFGSIPAGYTYLGPVRRPRLDLRQDRRHARRRTSPPPQLIQARSPSLDLDSLYGAGPGDPGVGQVLQRRPAPQDRRDRARSAPPPLQADGFDLPRVGGSGSRAKQRKALIPDPRNDENLAVAQTHLAMIRFHNRVVDSAARARCPDTAAVRAGARHRHAPLPVDAAHRLPAADRRSRRSSTTCSTTAARSSRSARRPTDVPTMPIEFSVAAFRLGHAMVRARLRLEPALPGRRGTLELLFDLLGHSAATSAAGVRLPSNWIVDWRRLYDLTGEQSRADLAPPADVNRAGRHRHHARRPAAHLPAGTRRRPARRGDPAPNLAFRNLRARQDGRPRHRPADGRRFAAPQGRQCRPR